MSNKQKSSQPKEQDVEVADNPASTSVPGAVLNALSATEESGKTETKPAPETPTHVSTVDTTVRRVDVRGLRFLRPMYGNEDFRITKGSRHNMPVDLYKKLVKLDPPVVELV